ncbi:hypothetical protein P879_02318 [Paragonimus westermani]|uniref:Uncharacterized protein n=1 Tax=Paragonimus westermani TaxID=34504 RepID=A0A8T0DRN0_9TREM|nr:hypothetical protein P879_02318 [Paragonimus westermani]
MGEFVPYNSNCIPVRFLQNICFLAVSAANRLATFVRNTVQPLVMWYANATGNVKCILWLRLTPYSEVQDKLEEHGCRGKQADYSCKSKADRHCVVTIYQTGENAVEVSLPKMNHPQSIQLRWPMNHLEITDKLERVEFRRLDKVVPVPLCGLEKMELSIELPHHDVMYNFDECQLQTDSREVVFLKPRKVKLKDNLSPTDEDVCEDGLDKNSPAESVHSMPLIEDNLSSDLSQKTVTYTVDQPEAATISSSSPIKSCTAYSSSFSDEENENSFQNSSKNQNTTRSDTSVVVHVPSVEPRLPEAFHFSSGTSDDSMTFNIIESKTSTKKPRPKSAKIRAQNISNSVSNQSGSDKPLEGSADSKKENAQLLLKNAIREHQRNSFSPDDTVSHDAVKHTVKGGRYSLAITSNTVNQAQVSVLSRQFAPRSQSLRSCTLSQNTKVTKSKAKNLLENIPS